MNLSQKMKNLRERYLSGLARIKTEKKICAAIQKEMQESCPHSAVIHFIGRWYHSVGDDAVRHCWACGFYEQGKRQGRVAVDDVIVGQEFWEFKILTAEPIAAVLANHDCIYRIMATPVEKLLEELKKIEQEYRKAHTY